MKSSGILSASVFFLTIGWMVTPGYAAPGEVHDAAADWDKDNNPNGDWSYVFNDLAGSFYPNPSFPGATSGTLMPQQTIFGRNFWALTNNADCCLQEAGSFFGYPLSVGANGPAGIRWTVPAGTTPTVTISAAIRQIFEPERQKRIEIQLNGQDIPHNGEDITELLATPPTINDDPNTSVLVTLSPEPVLAVSEGDFIDFIMDPYGMDGNGLTTLSLNYLTITEEPATLVADVDNDGHVDGNDYLLIQSTNPSIIPQWQIEFGSILPVSGSSAQAVPEPATAFLLALAAVVLLVQRAKPIAPC